MTCAQHEAELQAAIDRIKALEEERDGLAAQRGQDRLAFANIATGAQHVIRKGGLPTEALAWLRKIADAAERCSSDHPADDPRPLKVAGGAR